MLKNQLSGRTKNHSRNSKKNKTKQRPCTGAVEAGSLRASLKVASRHHGRTSPTHPLIPGPRLGLRLQDPATSHHTGSRITLLGLTLPHCPVTAPGSPDHRIRPLVPRGGPCARLEGLSLAWVQLGSGTRARPPGSGLPARDRALGGGVSSFSASSACLSKPGGNTKDPPPRSPVSPCLLQAAADPAD